MTSDPKPTNSNDVPLATPVNPSDNPFSSRHMPDRAIEHRGAQSHRSILILVLGISSWILFCPVLAVIAWIFGTADLREMASGKMSDSGWKWTNIGRTLGIVYTIVWLLAAVVGLSILMYVVAD